MDHIFFEVPEFTEDLYKIATEDEFAKLQRELDANPEKGALIKGLGGARKVRMAIRGRGKSGGARVIYYVRVKEEIWFLNIYAKNEQEDLNSQERKSLARIIDSLKRASA